MTDSKLEYAIQKIGFSLMIGNGENLGTEVIIIIPYQNGDEKSEYSISR